MKMKDVGKSRCNSMHAEIGGVKSGRVGHCHFAAALLPDAYLCVVAESSFTLLAANAACLVAAERHSSIKAIPHVHLTK